jgi:hypothetical protein
MPAIAEYVEITPTSGNLRACCPDCFGRIFRRASLARLAAVSGNLTITFPDAQQRIVESVDPCLNCDLERVPDAQPGK